MKKIILLAFLLTNNLIFASNTWQPPNKDDFNNHDLKKYSKFHALILKEEANLFIDFWQNDFKLFYDIKRRIQILDSLGIKYAVIQIPYLGKKNLEKFLNIEGYIFRLENGRVISKKIEKKNIKTVKINEYLFLKIITFPQAKVGDIIDIYYTLASSNFQKLRKWYFQHYDLPCKYSEINLTLPHFIEYQTVINNKNKLAKNSKKDTSIIINYKAKGKKIPLNLKAYKLTLAMGKELPFKKEPFMPSPENYIHSVDFFLKDLNFKQQQNLTPKEITAFNHLKKTISFGYVWNFTMLKKSYVLTFFKNNFYSTKNWQDFDRQFIIYEKQLDENLNTQKILKDKKNDFDKIIAIYDYVRKNIKWNKIYSPLPSLSPKQVQKRKKGNSADINFLLISLLRNADFEAFPVIIKTQNFGWIIKDFSSILQFNNVIAGVYLDTTLILLDATDENRPWFVLSKNDLNLEGRLIRFDKSRWINLKSPVKPSLQVEGVITFSRDTVFYELNLIYKGGMINDSNKIFSKKYKIRQNIKQTDPTTYVSKVFFSSKNHEIIDTFWIDTRINIFKIFNLSNPFQSKKRKYPVFFGEPFVKTFSLTVTYDNFLMLTKWYRKFNYQFEGGSIVYDHKVIDINWLASDLNDTLYLDLNINLEKALIPKEEYKNFRKGFAMMGWLKIADFVFTEDIE